MDYEYIIEVYETYDVNEVNFLLKKDWVLLLPASPMPKLDIKYSLGWDKRKGEIPKEKYEPDLSGYDKKFLQSMGIIPPDELNEG